MNISSKNLLITAATICLLLVTAFLATSILSKPPAPDSGMTKELVGHLLDKLPSFTRENYFENYDGNIYIDADHNALEIISYKSQQIIFGDEAYCDAKAPPTDFCPLIIKVYKRSIDYENLSLLGKFIKSIAKGRIYQVDVEIGVSIFRNEGLTLLVAEITTDQWLIINAINTYIA